MTATGAALAAPALDELLADVARPVCAYGVAGGGVCVATDERVATRPGGAVLAHVPPVPPESLGDRGFLAAHGARQAYVAGAMAGGIASEELVVAMATAGMLSFFGAGGLGRARVEQAIARIRSGCAGRECWGVNLLPDPMNPREEEATVELFLRRGVRCVSASAYMQLSAALVRYRLHGLHAGRDGEPVAPNRLVAKVSRTEVARAFMEPPPEAMVRALVRAGALTETQARLAARLPMAEDVDAEADSGGHTDGRPALPLLSAIGELRDAVMRERGYRTRIRVGLAGGIGTPAAVVAALAAGADYVVTGSVNQACVEAATSDAVKAMLAEADAGAVAMAPAADMFEMGVNVQVLRHRTLFAARARKLYELYRSCRTLDDIPAAEREQLERRVFRRPLADVWRDTEAFFRERDPAQLERAAAQPKHRLALAFRWYLGMSSRWAREGDPERTVDYQVWCSAAMGAFNAWVRGSFLEPLAARTVVAVAENLMHGACMLWRLRLLAQQLALHGAAVPGDPVVVRPRRAWSERPSVLRAAAAGG